MDIDENATRYELVWRGRTHLGSEPGVYGDACFSGLCAEWPLTLRKFDRNNAAGGVVRLRLEAEDVQTYSPYPGHRVTVFRYVPDPSPGNRHGWRRLAADPAVEHWLKDDLLELDIVLPADYATVYASVHVEVGTDMHPALYDDFVLTRLSLWSMSHYAVFGFEYEDNPRLQIQP